MGIVKTMGCHFLLSLDQPHLRMEIIMKYEYCITAGPGTLIDSGKLVDAGQGYLTPESTWGFEITTTVEWLLYDAIRSGQTIMIGPSDYQEDGAE